jgi:hypothetical protein
MITFHSRQSDCARYVRKNEIAGTFNFASQIASSICPVAFTNCEKSDATIFTSRCSRTAVSYRFREGHALPLSKVRFSRLVNGSSANRPNPARRSRNGREPSGKKSDKVSRSILHNFRTIADNGQCNAAAFPREQLARQLVIWQATIRKRQFHIPHNGQCNIPRTIPQADSSKYWHQVFNHNAQQL